MGGSLSNWDVIPRLPKITAPTLVYNGEYDTSHDIAQVPFFELIPQVRWITISGGGHMCHLEGDGRRERVLKVVGEFLTQEGPSRVLYVAEAFKLSSLDHKLVNSVWNCV